VRGRIRAKGEIELIGAVAQLIQHAARLHQAYFSVGLISDLVQTGRINDHGIIAGLSAEAGAAATRQERAVVLARESDNLDYFVDRFRE